MTLRTWLVRWLVKGSATTRSLVAFTAAGQAVWTPRNYEQLSKEGYEANATVYACVNEVARALSGLDWLLQRRWRGGRAEELDEHPLLDLLARPNPFEGQTSFFAKLAGHLLLQGNGYLEALAPSREGAPPRELYVLRPDRMTVVPDAVDRVAGYEWRANGQIVRFRAERILHVKLFHPTNDWYGLSPLDAAARSVDVDNETLRSNMKFLQNGFRPSGALTVAGNLGDDVFTRLKAQVQAEYGGADRSGAPMLLEGDMKWQDMSLSPRDLDYLGGRKMSQLDICRAYNVPPELVNLKESTFENRKEARKALYTEAVLPLADLLRDELNQFLVPRFGDRLQLDYDRDAIEALQEDRKSLWERVDKAAELTVNEKRVAKGYDERPDGDVLLVPINQVPLDQVGLTGPDFADLPGEADGEPAGDDPEADAEALDDKGLTGPASPRAHLWTKAALEFLPIERRYHAALRRWLAAQAREVLGRLRRLRRLHDGAVLATKDTIDILFEIDEETGRLRQVSRPYFEEAQRRGAASVELDLGLSGGFSPEAPAPQQALQTQLNGLRGVTERTHEALRAALEQALNAPDGVPPVEEIADRLRQVYRGLSEHRARTIARTETARAFNDGTFLSMQAAGIDEVEWLSARDEAVRTNPFNHAIDGERRRLGLPFSNGLRYPHAPEGSPGNVINCRCVLLPVVRS